MVWNTDIERSAGKEIETNYFNLAYNDVPFYRELPKNTAWLIKIFNR